MGAIPAEIDADAGPPMAIPLRHFVVGLSFLLTGAVVGVSASVGVLPGQSALAHVHLLLVGWVCVTIMGAMTQFVPVWSGTALHSRWLARTQLWAVSVGLAGFVASLLGGFYPWLPAFGAVMLLGFWLFGYNVGRTLLSVRPWDVTERHFAIALGFFVVVTLFGVVLALGFTHPMLADLPITQRGLRESHATLAIFGVVLTTVFGALYQLGTMFTQTALHGVDVHLRRIEAVGYPLGVVALAAGRLLGHPQLARIGGLLVIFGVASVGFIVGRRLFETHVEWNPMLRRYAVVVAAMLSWAVVTLPAWYADPLSPNATLGSPAGAHLLLVGVVGFVVLGTLYHVVPFIVWVHRYSDRLGYEPVPMVDDLYDDRIAVADLACVTLGASGLVAATAFDRSIAVTAAAGALATVGFALFATNVLLVVREHSPRPLRAVLVSRLGEGGDPTGDSASDGPNPTEDTVR